jgi:hypothetical protein
MGLDRKRLEDEVVEGELSWRSLLRARGGDRLGLLSLAWPRAEEPVGSIDVGVV